MQKNLSSAKPVRIIPLISTVLLLGSILLMTVMNAVPIWEIAHKFMTRETTFEAMTSEISNQLLSDDLWQKTTFIDLNGFFSRISGRQNLNDITVLKNGMLADLDAVEMPMDDRIQSVADISALAQKLDIPFLYVQAPGKIDTEKQLVPDYQEDFSNENADRVLAGLREQEVNILDLRPFISQTSEMVDRYFYVTDHHWSVEGAFVGFQNIMSCLNELVTDSLDMQYTDRSRWNSETVSNCFLGSWGRRVGRGFAGLDDMTYLTPDFDSNMSCLIMASKAIVKQGSFEDALLWKEYLSNQSLYENSPYNVFLDFDHELLRCVNPDAPNHKKLLVIKDSYSKPVITFLSTEFTEVEAIDPRHFSACSIAEYIRMSEPDVLIMMIAVGSMKNDELFDLGGNVALEALELTYSEPQMHELGNLSLSANEDDYANLILANNIKPGKTYTLSMDSIDAESGAPGIIQAVLYSSKQNKAVDMTLWDVAFDNMNGLEWVFTAPEQADNEVLELRIYAGIMGQTHGNSIALHNVSLSEVHVLNGEKPVYAAAELNVEPKDFNYQNVTLPVTLTPGKTYQLSVDSAYLTQGVAGRLSVELHPTANGPSWLHTDFALDGEPFQWVFTAPEDEGYVVRLFAGVMGETENIGVSFRHVVLSELIPEYGEEVFSLDEAELVYSKYVSQKYNSFTYPCALEPGETYTLCIDDIELLGGSTYRTEATLYRSDINYTIASNAWGLSQDAPFIWTFTVPDEPWASDCQLKLYAGMAGETMGQSILYKNLTLYRQNRTKNESPVYASSEVYVEASGNIYNCAVLPVTLLPGHSYSVLIRNASLSDPVGDSLTIKVQSRSKNAEIIRRDWYSSSWSDGILWSFEIPDDIISGSDCQLQLFSGEVGKAANISAVFRGVSVVENTVP